MTKRLLWLCLASALPFTLTACGPSYPNCDNDEDCHEGEFCVNGECQQCREDSDCPSGQACNDGRCDPIPGYCNGNGDCPSGQECVNNRCVAESNDTTPPPDNDPPPQACELNPIYFGFDADELDPAARNGIDANVRCMRERGINNVHVTGHCDPRGTEEYNLALGDRRARAVAQYMVSLGLDANAVTSSSMGEEMGSGTDESGWSRDRRVEFTQR